MGRKQYGPADQYERKLAKVMERLVLRNTTGIGTGASYKDLAEIYCTTPDSIYSALRRARKSGTISV